MNLYPMVWNESQLMGQVTAITGTKLPRAQHLDRCHHTVINLLLLLFLFYEHVWATVTPTYPTKHKK